MTPLAARLAGMKALRLEREPPSAIAAIVIVGSTCTGKTTLVQALRAAAIPGVDIPQRFVTRARRPDDVAVESQFVTKAQLETSIAAGETAMHWSRTLEAGHTELYAFARPAPATLPVYSANNAIYVAGNVQPADALGHALLVGMHAPDDVRAQRLRARSPQLLHDHHAEAQARLSDRADNVLPHVHIVVENHGLFEAVAASELVALIRAIAAER